LREQDRSGPVERDACGRKPTVAPRPMTRAEFRQTVAGYAQAAHNAIEAGFDGVQIMANYRVC
jgi:N-ethylmaleimide reductase